MKRFRRRVAVAALLALLAPAVTAAVATAKSVISMSGSTSVFPLAVNLATTYNAATTTSASGSSREAPTSASTMSRTAASRSATRRVTPSRASIRMASCFTRSRGTACA